MPTDIEGLILDELKELRGDVKGLTEKVAKLQVKSSLWSAVIGAIAGGVPAATVAIYWFMTR